MMHEVIGDCYGVLAGQSNTRQYERDAIQKGSRGSPVDKMEMFFDKESLNVKRSLLVWFIYKHYSSHVLLFVVRYIVDFCHPGFVSGPQSWFAKLGRKPFCKQKS